MSSDFFDWSPENIARLQQLWAEGHSTAEIGRRLGVSKNSIISKAHRLHLQSRPSPIIRGDGPRPPKAPPRAPPKTLPPLVSVAVVVRHERPVPPQIKAPAEAVPVVLVSKPCCWPMWKNGKRPTHQYCEAPGIPGRPYCRAHADKAFVRLSQVAPSVRSAHHMVRAA